MYSIKEYYKEIRNKILRENNVAIDDFATIKKTLNNNADNIITLVKEKIFNNVIDEGENYIEMIKFSIDLVICYGFIHCHILERPQND